MPERLIREPIYQQLNQVLRSLLRSREFPVGSQFLTEREVSKRFSVSRVTANKALSNLVSEGELEFRKGVGTFVRSRALDYNLRSLVSFTDEAAALGKRPSTEVIHYDTMTAGEILDEVPSMLNVEPEDQVLFLERLRSADDIPVILERRYVVASYCPGLSSEDVRGSLYSLWKERYQLPIEGAHQSIRAVNIRGDDARRLGVGQGAAGLLVISTGFLSGGRPLWFERTLYRGDTYEFQNRLGGIAATGPPLGRFL